MYPCICVATRKRCFPIYFTFNRPLWIFNHPHTLFTVKRIYRFFNFSFQSSASPRFKRFPKARFPQTYFHEFHLQNKKVRSQSHAPKNVALICCYTVHSGKGMKIKAYIFTYCMPFRNILNCVAIILYHTS